MSHQNKVAGELRKLIRIDNLVEGSPQHILLRAIMEIERLDDLINSPQTEDFFAAARLEAAHQIDRWGEAQKRGKSAEGYFWLVGYLAGKALRAVLTRDRDKALHHTISSAAALANWHDSISTSYTHNLGAAPDLDLAKHDAPQS